MAGNNQLIMGATAAGGTTGTGLAWFAPQGTAGPVAVAYTAEVQTITITGTPTGGTFTPVWQGLAAAAQAYNVPTATLATALNTAWASKLAGGTVAVAGTAGTSYQITFPAGLGNVAMISLVKAFTGGSSPDATVAETTPGAGANPATAIIPTSFKDAGMVDPAGLAMKVAESTNDVRAFGSLQVQRTFFTEGKQTFDLTFLETNHTSLEVYHRLPIGTTGTAGMDGYISGVTDGVPQVQFYSGVFDVVDGLNHLRAYCPSIQNTGRGDMNIGFGQAVKRPVTLTAYPDTNGVAIYWYPVMNALAGL